jgi:hypothetical protein
LFGPFFLFVPGHASAPWGGELAKHVERL